MERNPRNPFVAKGPNPGLNVPGQSVKDHPGSTSRSQAWEAREEELWKASQQKHGDKQNTEIEIDEIYDMVWLLLYLCVMKW